MISVLGELPLSYAVLSEGRRCGSASAAHEPSPAGPPDQASSITPAGRELLVAERDWQPPRPRFAHDQIVGLRVPLPTWPCAWNPERRVWQLRYDRVVALGLNGR